MSWSGRIFRPISQTRRNRHAHEPRSPDLIVWSFRIRNKLDKTGGGKLDVEEKKESRRGGTGKKILLETLPPTVLLIRATRRRERRKRKTTEVLFLLALYPPLTLPTFLLVSSLPPFLLLLELLSPASKRKRERHREKTLRIWVGLGSGFFAALPSFYLFGRGRPLEKEEKKYRCPQKKLCKNCNFGRRRLFSLPKNVGHGRGKKGQFLSLLPN